MYKLNETTGGDNARQVLVFKPPFGPGVADPSILSRAELVETWGSGVNDPGEDFCEFRVFDAVGTRIGTFRVDGY